MGRRSTAKPKPDEVSEGVTQADCVAAQVGVNAALLCLVGAGMPAHAVMLGSAGAAGQLVAALHAGGAMTDEDRGLVVADMVSVLRSRAGVNAN